jgi:protein-S-isoprenylcysteine O-methyltransferase Ste14
LEVAEVSFDDTGGVSQIDRSSRRPGKWWFVAGYAGVAGFFAVEAVARQRGRASSLDADQNDRDSTRMIVVAGVLAAALSPALRRLPLRPLPRSAAPLGLTLQATGLGLRIWSMRTLGSSYSRTLRAEQEQQVVDDGPYRLIRHPGYLGSLLTWTGFGLTSGSLPVAVSVGGLLARAYRHRIAAEEDLLCRDLPGYLEYSGRTKKLIPFIW